MEIRKLTGYYTRQLIFIFIMLCLMLLAVERILHWEYLFAGASLKIILPNGLRVLQPNLNTTIIGDAGTPIRVHTNSKGFATEEHSLTAATNTYRIAFMGSSFTQGFQVDHDKKFTSLVERTLNETMGRNSYRFEVMNFGMGAYSYPEQLLLYREYVRKYKPDLVLLQAYVGFDFSTNLRFLEKKDYFLRTPLNELDATEIIETHAPEAPADKNWKTNLAKRFEVVRYVIRLVRENQILYDLAIRLGLLNRPFTEDVGNFLTEMWSYLDPEAEVQKEIMTLTGDLIARVGEDVQRDGAEFAVIILPSYWQVHDRYIEELRNKKDGGIDLLLPNKIVRDRLKENQGFIDLSTPIAQALNIEKKEVFINDVGHFTAYGHELAAREIAIFFERAYRPVVSPQAMTF